MPGSGNGDRATTSASPASTRYDRELTHLARLEGQVDRELGKGLALLWDRERYRSLGFVRATDFVREMLGIQEGRARWLAKLGRYLAAVPELDRALAQDRICASQAIDLGTLLGPESSAQEREDWIARAERLGVRELRRAVRAEKQRRAAKEGSTATETTIAADDSDEPAGSYMAIPAPVRGGVLWHDCLEMARMVAGQHCAQGQAAELMCAEYLSWLGPETASPKVQVSSRAANEGQVDPARERLIAEVIEALNRQFDVAQTRNSKAKWSVLDEALRTAALSNPSQAIRSVQPAPIPELPPDCRVSEHQDPWALAASLCRLMGLKRHLRHELAGLLSTFMSEVSPMQLGFPTLEAYCLERLGFGVRRAERLARFHAGLARFPLLLSAYLEGRISYTAALLLLTILHRSTEEAWVSWADGMTYREIERVVEHARTFALPEANPAVLQGFLRELEAQGLARRKAAGDETVDASAFAAAGISEEATAFALDESKVPPGCALPPEPGGLPRISGFPKDLLLAEADHHAAQIRFWISDEGREVVQRALDRCRQSMPNPFLPTWAYFEVILVHFMLTHDTPEARTYERRHKIIARDHFRCVVSGCMSRRNLNSHHLEHQGQQGTDHEWNQAGGCDGHHGAGVHKGIIDIGGFAPDRLVFRLGIHPKTGKALVCYRNERRVSPEVAAEDLARWRRFWRDWHAHKEQRPALEESVRLAGKAPMAEMKPVETAVLQLA